MVSFENYFYMSWYSSKFFKFVLINALFSFLEIEERTNPDLCTYVKTGNSFQVQKFFRCITCGLGDTNHKGACKICVKTCHAGHDVRFSKNDLFFCDCGLEGEKSCRSLLKKQSSMYFYPYQFQDFYLLLDALRFTEVLRWFLGTAHILTGEPLIL